MRSSSPGWISSAWRCRPRRCRPRSARSAIGSGRAPRCCCSPRAWCSRWASCRATTSASGSARARSPRWAAPPTRVRRPPGWPRWCWARATRTCGPSWARSSIERGWSANAAMTWSGSRWRASPRTPPPSARRRRRPTASMPRGSPPRRSGASASSTRWRAARELDTFTGLAGVGDLTATVLAPGSRNRRAGELLGAGVAADQIPGRIGQASEGLDSVPLLAESMARAGIEAPGLDGLAALISGRIDPGEWVAGLRRAERGRRAA